MPKHVNRRRIVPSLLHFCLLTLATTIPCMPALAELAEHQVMLLYNGRVDESLSIRNAYIAHHPGVHQFDLDLEYPTTYENWPDSDPPPEGITNHYITSAKFLELFSDDAGAFQQYLAAHPEVLALATTRGLPSVVSDNFDPPVNHDQPSAENIWGSFETLLSRSSVAVYEWEDLADSSSRQNPYYGSIVPFQEKLDLCGEYGGICPGDLYLVSRLDSSICATDYDGNGSRTHLDGVLALIDRCAEPIPINTYATTMLFDDNPPTGTPDDEIWCTHAVKIPNNFEIAQSSFKRDNWCQMEDQTIQFLHGPNHDLFDPLTDGPFMEYPTVSLVTMGRNHCGSRDNPDELASYDYIRRYQAHPAGFFTSIESYNGRCLHKFQASPDGHGQILDWIGYAGGSFATGHVQGISTSEFMMTFIGMQNLYHGGFSWGEAVYTFLRVGGYNAPIGDPLARVVLVRPDINEDRVVDDIDRDIVLAQMGGSGPEGDLDGNGLVDEHDLAEIDRAFGRAQPEIEVPDPFVGLSACGDLTSDGAVDIADILRLISDWGDCPLQGSCPSDTNGDYVVEIGDLLTVISKWGWSPGDLDENGIININDLLLILDLQGTTPDDENWIENADTDCDGVIQTNDVAYIMARIGSG